MILVFDTETSGLPNFKLDLDDPLQPYIVQLAFACLNDDFKVISEFNCYIKHNVDFIIEAGAFDAHHITHDILNKYGVSIEVALSIFEEFASIADKVVAFNLKFDSMLLDIAASRLDSNRMLDVDWKNKGFCAMLASTDICKCKYKDPRKTGYKWPKLEEAYKFMYPDEAYSIEHKAHNAKYDVLRTCKVLEYLVKNNHVKL